MQMQAVIQQRLVALRATLQAQELSALLVDSEADRRYLSGFSGSNGALLISADAAFLFSDFRYESQAASESPAFTFRLIDIEHPLPKLIAAAAEEFGFAKIGFDPQSVSYAQHQALAKACEEITALVPVGGLVLGLRAVKDDFELERLQRAIAITDAAITAVVPQLQSTMSERQAAWMLEVAMRERGAEAAAFTIIVAAGPNAALPHARPGDGLLGEGRPIVIDMGAKVEGYHADLTRTVILGEPDEQFRRIYGIVLEAQRRAIAAVRPGVTGIAVDAAARDYIEEQGYGDYFGHGTGHGVGLVIHELPAIRRLAAGQQGPVLQVGNLFSVEPGIYLPEWGGVRIEDLVLVEAESAKVLSGAAK